jgi:dTDP-4-amino-4,6-dideoxygalactose transaminase
MIPFNVPPKTGQEIAYIQQALASSKISGDGPFSKKCQAWFDQQLSCKKSLLTPSCTAALEMAALLLDIQPGDEVIMPSYTFVSTANAFVLRGAKIVFIDVHPDTMNINENLIEAAITDSTKVIVPVHYAGVPCEMDTIMAIAKKYGLYVVEDAAQSMMSTYKGRPAGTSGHMAAYSFHETKNYTAGGEGGLLIINDPRFAERAEIIREKGTNRSQFFRGQVDKYSWVDCGSSFLPSDIQAAYLWAQLEGAEQINDARLGLWHQYQSGLQPLADAGCIELLRIPESVKHNGHLFALKCKDLEERSALIDHLKAKGVLAVFHYIPLHSSVAGERYSRFHGEDQYTTRESERLLRLPMWYGLELTVVERIVAEVFAFYQAK